MEKQLLNLLGNAFKHVLGGILHALRAVALAFIIVAILAAAATEAVGFALTRQLPPSGPTHLAAAALAIAFGYAAAITVAIEEILRTMIKAFEFVVQEAEKLGKEAVEEAEKLGRAAVTDAGRLGRTVAGDAGALGHSVVTDASALGRTVTGAVSGVVGGIAHEGRALEQGVASHVPGHHGGSSTAASNAPTLPSGN